MREKIQRFGGFLAGMIIPNIGAFICLGFDHSHVYRHGVVAQREICCQC